MIYKREFDEERNECEGAYPIEEDITDPTLIEINRFYGQADALSLKYAEIHHEKIRNISLIAPLIVFFFLLYEAAAQHWLIFVVTALIILLYIVYRQPSEEKTLEKYLEYRVLAEALRIQYFLSKAGIKKKALDILPWFTEIRVPLVKEVLSELSSTEAKEKGLILDCWIRDQMKYHDKAHKRALKQLEKNEFYERISLLLTIIFYVIALIFEILMIIYAPFESLPSKVEEHLRMYWLYQKMEHKIRQTKKENEEDIIYLAEQCLIENASWYSHQKKNTPDFAVE